MRYSWNFNCFSKAYWNWKHRSFLLPKARRQRGRFVCVCVVFYRVSIWNCVKRFPWFIIWILCFCTYLKEEHSVQKHKIQGKLLTFLMIREAFKIQIKCKTWFIFSTGGGGGICNWSKVGLVWYCHPVH